MLLCSCRMVLVVVLVSHLHPCGFTLLSLSYVFLYSHAPGGKRSSLRWFLISRGVPFELFHMLQARRELQTSYSLLVREKSSYAFHVSFVLLNFFSKYN